MAWKPWAAVALLVVLSGCGAKAERPQQAGLPPVAGYVVATAQDVPLPVELAGRTAAFETAQVRPQVSGVIRARRFAEGAVVREGQTLYEIDPAIYGAAASQAQANLVSARAARDAAEAKLARYTPLATSGFVSKQDFDDVTAAARQAVAQVGQAQAAVQTARINLDFTRVPAPISGRIGRSLVTTGALVTNGQADPLATIERLDPMFVDIQQSSADATALRRALAGGGMAPGSATVRLTLEDGAAYPYAGRIEFSEAVVDPDTGAVTLRAQFPNPQGLLLPGMFVRAHLDQGVARGAILVSQAAVSRNPRGDATVWVVDAQSHAQLRGVTADRTIGDKWLVTRGLAPGERVIVQGLDGLKPGEPVRPVPAGAAHPGRAA
jgi:membrane fusion protein (multidrug efflux system)